MVEKIQEETDVTNEVEKLLEEIVDVISLKRDLVPKDATADQLNYSVQDSHLKKDVQEGIANINLKNHGIEEDKISFMTRTIQFRESFRRIVMQSKNGPCPLIAVVNALSLLGRITIPAKKMISRGELTDLIGTLITDLRLPCHPSEQLPNHEKKIDDVLDVLPSLTIGLDINLKFNDITSFEYTKAIDLFDLLNLRLYHAWKVEGEFVAAVGELSYSQVAERAITNNVLMDFLVETQSQMTYSGLFALIETVPENAISILFRNNHFHTILKENNKLYLLATDEGFIGHAAVWEILENIDGDSVFVDMDFKSLEADRNVAVAVPSTGTIPSLNSSIASDFELAKQLQEQERHKASFSGNSSPNAPSTHSNTKTIPRIERPPEKKEKVSLFSACLAWIFQCHLM